MGHVHVECTPMNAHWGRYSLAFIVVFSLCLILKNIFVFQNSHILYYEPSSAIWATLWPYLVDCFQPFYPSSSSSLLVVMHICPLTSNPTVIIDIEVLEKLWTKIDYILVQCLLTNCSMCTISKKIKQNFATYALSCLFLHLPSDRL